MHEHVYAHVGPDYYSDVREHRSTYVGPYNYRLGYNTDYMHIGTKYIA